jgi:hypothetical protein
MVDRLIDGPGQHVGSRFVAGVRHARIAEEDARLSVPQPAFLLITTLELLGEAIRSPLSGLVLGALEEGLVHAFVPGQEHGARIGMEAPSASVPIRVTLSPRRIPGFDAAGRLSVATAADGTFGALNLAGFVVGALDSAIVVTRSEVALGSDGQDDRGHPNAVAIWSMSQATARRPPARDRQA